MLKYSSFPSLTLSIRGLDNGGSYNIQNNLLQTLPLELRNISSSFLNFEFDGNPFSAIPPDVVAWGEYAIFAYLQDEVVRREAEKQRLMLIGVSGVGLLSVLMLGFRLKQRGQRKSKKKRELV